MKWLTLCVLVCLTRFCHGGALKCTRDTQDPGCQQEILEKGEEIKCTPNTTFTRDCNTCLCLENGLGLCTLKNCHSETSSVPKKSELVDGKECAADSLWRSQCNECICSPDGYSFCTEKACPGQESEPLKRCAPDSMWKDDCNTCWCTKDGLPICTRVGCVDSSINNSDKGKGQGSTIAEIGDAMEIVEAYSEVQNDNCEVHSKENAVSIEELESNVKYIDTNSHKINDELENSESRTHEHGHNAIENEEESQSHSTIKRSVCKPNQPFQIECNSCKCASDGQRYTCSHNECMDEVTVNNKDVEVFIESDGVDHIESHSVCKPSGTFYIGCNTCHCNYYGTDYSCTNKPCPLPEDVELFHELKDMKPIIPFINEDGQTRNLSGVSDHRTRK